MPIKNCFVTLRQNNSIMKIETIAFNPKPRNQSEILISWVSGETTSLLFNSIYPLQVREYYERAIYDLFKKKHDIVSFDELFGLFSWWFVKHNLIMPLMVATFSNEDRKRIGARIKEIREEIKLEAKQLSMITGIDAANLSRIEQGKCSAGVDTLAKIANALGYKIDFVKLNNNVMNQSSIHLGKHSDSFEYLQSLSEKEAKSLCSTLNLSIGEKKEIAFWTDGIPELIAVASFEKKSNGEVIYEIDYSQSTL